MSFFREVHTGQVVEITDPPFYLGGLARWERTEEDPRDPAELAAIAEWLAAEAEHQSALAQAELESAREDAKSELAGLDAALAAPLTDEGTTPDKVDEAVAAHDEVVGNDDPAPAPVDDSAAGDTSAADGEPIKPADDATREQWIDYAIAQGKGPDFKGIKTAQIKSWFN